MLLAGGATALAEESYWLTLDNPSGNFFYRTKSGGEKLALDQFTPLLKAYEVYCEKLPCGLRYASRDSIDSKPMPLKLTPKKWKSVSRATTEPEPPVMLLPSEWNPKGRPGGREKGGLCSGTLAVQAPVCEEVIDVQSFGLEWTPPPGLRGRIEVRLSLLDAPSSGADALSPLYTEIEAGQYSGPALHDQILRLQRNDSIIGLRVELKQSESVRATRTIIIPTRKQHEAFQKQFADASLANPTLLTLARMRVALDAERWTVAAKEALRLQLGNQQSRALDTYVFIGLCRSGYDDARETLRARLTGVDTAQICAPTSGAGLQPAIIPTATPSTKKRRTGRALLIGNFAYPEDELEAVRHDIEGMRTELTSLGFEIVDGPNLDTASEFTEIVRNFAKGQTADDIALVYYSGHGMQYKGRTHLLGKNFARLGQVSAALLNSVKLDDIVEEMESQPALARIVIFDGCRNNIFAKEENTELGDVHYQRKYPNTAIMLANTPGKPVAARAVGEFRSPFTEGLIYGFSRAKGGIQDIFELAKAKTAALNPGQTPELRLSDTVDPSILRGIEGKASNQRQKELLEKACPFYHNRSWGNYVPMMNIARELSDDAAERLRLATEIQFATLVQKAEEAGIIGNNQSAEELWRKASDIFPSRNWVRMRAALAALANDDVGEALVQLADMPPGPDPGVHTKAERLWTVLAASFPKEAEMAHATAKSADIEAAECVEVVKR